MTTTAGKVPLPSGTARNALISSSPDLMVMSDVLTCPSAEGTRNARVPIDASIRDANTRFMENLHGCGDAKVQTTGRILCRGARQGKRARARFAILSFRR